MVTKKRNGWFDVDKEGLAGVMERRGKSFAVVEIVSNALDQKTTKVEVVLERSKPGRARLTVTDDDPAGFADISHAWTVFAESGKKGDPTKRGRFNIGEKLALSLCRSAEVRTTTGSVQFCEDGTRTSGPAGPTKVGSIFSADIALNADELRDACRAVQRLLVPEGILLTLNGEPVQSRRPVANFEADLPTEIAGEDGVLRRTHRKTKVSVYEPMPDEETAICELGVPVVDTGDRFTVDVGQRVPLNLERDNVAPAFLRRVRTLVLENCHSMLDSEAASEPWARDGMSAPDVKPEATLAIMKKRFGEKAVAQDPRDPEANKIAVAAGFSVVHGRSLTAGEWANAKAAGALRPAGQVTPSPKVEFATGGGDGSIPMDKWTDAERRIADYARRLGRALLDKEVAVEWRHSFTATDGYHRRACYNREAGLTLSRKAIGGLLNEEALDALLLHEFAHDFSSDHFDADFIDAACSLGAAARRCDVRLACGCTPESFCADCEVIEIQQVEP